jgi:hypothetical protein
MDVSLVDDAALVACSGTPFMVGYPFDSVTGFGTKYSNPATLPSNTSRGAALLSVDNTVGGDIAYTGHCT